MAGLAPPGLWCGFRARCPRGPWPTPASEASARVASGAAGAELAVPIKLPSFRPRRDAYPADLWTKSPTCGEMLFNKQLDKADRVCPNCGHHFRLSPFARLELV